jgi:hypothetical protein
MFGGYLNRRKKALVIGTGGGNDIASALIPAQHLQKKGIQTDIAGILSPAAVHRFDGRIEDVVNRIAGPIERYIPSPTPVSISFLDEALTIYTKSAGIPIPHFYDLSTRFGTARLVEGVNDLIEQRGYSFVVAVDVGGDILGRGKQDPTLLSPMMDFTSLYLLTQLKAPTLLVEFGLGTDGELRPAGMAEILQELADEKLLFHESRLTAQDEEIGRFRKVFEKVKDIRAGHTAVMTLRTLDEDPAQDIVSEYYFRSQIGKQKWHTPFEVVLPRQYAGKSYLIDGVALAHRRRETAFAYANPLEQYVRLKTICPSWKTELDLFYLWDGDDWTTPQQQGQSLFLLAPSTSIPEGQRREMLQYGMLHSGADMLLLWTKDAKEIDFGGMTRADAGRFTLLTEHDRDYAWRAAAQVKEYQQRE